MIDTHSHLFEDDFNDDIELCIKRCKENNVNKIILVGFSYKTNRLAQEYANKYDIFYPTAGVHPEECNNNYLELFNELKEFIKYHKVYAIGECGLDYYWSTEFKEEQKKLFELQCDLAIELDLPIIIHSREAIQDTFDIIKEYNGKLKGVMHCYSGSLEMAKEFVKLGFYIGLDGPITYKNAKEPKRVCEGIDINNLLIETDCPYMTPTPFRGKRNESAYVKYILEAMANIKNISVEECDEITTRNAIKLFNL